MRWFLLLILSASVVWAQPLGADYRQTFDFSAAPITLTPGGAPLMLNVDYGEQFASYEDVFISVTFQNATKHITTQGLLLSNQAAPPSYASATEWGYAVMTGSSSSVAPSTMFSWNSGNGSEHWFNVGASEIAQEILDGQFTFFFQNAPLSQSPGLTSKEDLVVLSAEVVLRGAVLAPEPAPTDTDNDGVNDYREGRDGTDPNDATSFNPLSKGLVAYYPFDDNANDMSGYGNDGTVTGAMLTEDRIRPTSRAYVFDGIDDSIAANDSSLPSGNAPRTMSVWVKSAGWAGPENAHIVNYGTRNNGTAFGFWHRDNVVSFYGGGFGDVDLQDAGLMADTWEHLLVSYAADSVRVYRNGRFVIEQPRVLSTLLNLLVIGTAPSNEPSFSFTGAIDDIRIYNRSLTDAEIELLYYSEAFDQTQRDFLSSNPSVQGFFSLAQFNANRINGQTDVTTNPSAFNLFTQSQFDGNRTAGQQDVIASPMAYGLYDSNSIMDLRMGGLMIQKQGEDVAIVFQPQTTTDLATIPFTNSGTPITNTIPMTGRKSFLRINALPPISSGN